MGKSKKRIEGKREPNGRLSRRVADERTRFMLTIDKDQRETLGVGLEARERVNGTPIQQARDQMAGSFVGRLCMSSQLSSEQYDAAMTYLEDWENVGKAVHAPRQPGAVDLNATKGGSGDYENVALTRSRVERWRSAQNAVQGRQNELRGTGNLFAALDCCLLRDGEFHHLVGSLREALNALARHYRLTSSIAA